MTDTTRESVEREIRSAIMRERRSCEATLGKFLASLPLDKIVSAGASVGDLADAIKVVVAERDAARTALAAAEAREGELREALQLIAVVGFSDAPGVAEAIARQTVEQARAALKKGEGQ